MSGSDEERRVVEAATAAAGPVPVVLVGSRALGSGHEESDWDVLVVVPARRVPRLIPRLAAASARLGGELRAPVTLNPLPASRLAHPRASLFVWKVMREGRVLAAPGGFALPAAGPPPPVGPAPAFSYLASAVLWLLEADDEHTRRKARRHLAQLRLLRSGEYEVDPTLGDGDPLPAIARELAAIGCPYTTRRALRRNATYLLLSALRGRSRMRASCSLRAIDCRLLDAALALLAGDEPRLPAGVKGPAREAILREWPSAHPLLAL